MDGEQGERPSNELGWGVCRHVWAHTRENVCMYSMYNTFLRKGVDQRFGSTAVEKSSEKQNKWQMRCYKVAPAAVWTHCIIQHHTLAVNSMSQMSSKMSTMILWKMPAWLFPTCVMKQWMHSTDSPLCTQMSTGCLRAGFCPVPAACAKHGSGLPGKPFVWVYLNTLTHWIQLVFIVHEWVPAFRKKLKVWAAWVESWERLCLAQRAESSVITVTPVVSEHLRGRLGRCMLFCWGGWQTTMDF